MDFIWAGGFQIRPYKNFTESYFYFFSATANRPKEMSDQEESEPYAP